MPESLVNSDPNMLLVMAAVALVSFVGLVWAVFTSRREPATERLADVQQQPRNSPLDGMRDHQRVREMRKAWSQKDEKRRQLGDRLVQAGIYKRNSTTSFYLTQALLGAIPLLLGVGAARLGYTTISTGLLVGLMTGMAGVIAPGFWLAIQKSKRQTTIRRALPDALDLMVICVEAGLSLPAALVRITKELREAHPMLAVEMMIVHREIQLGHTTGEALRRFGERFDLDEVRGLSSVIRQAERFGASIVNAIRIHAETLRDRRMEMARERAQKAAVKLLFPTVLCIFPAMFVVILGPAVFDIFELFETITIPNIRAG